MKKKKKRKSPVWKKDLCKRNTVSKIIPDKKKYKRENRSIFDDSYLMF